MILQKKTVIAKKYYEILRIYLHRQIGKIKYTEKYYEKQRLSQRLGSEPYISGDTFRKYSDVLLQKGMDFSNTNNATVFWDRDSLTFEEVKKIVSKIQFNQNLKLIIHNTDQTLSQKEVDFLITRFIKIFSVNYIGEKNNVTQVPIGLENYYININGNFKNITTSPEKKYQKILVNFNTYTNRKFRGPLLKACLDYPDKFDYHLKFNSKKYFSELSKYRFVLSPPGNGLDCHRTWEAIYSKTIPIVFNSTLSSGFNDLPILVIEDIEEITKLTLQDLSNIYSNLITKSSEIAYFEYWKKLIFEK